MRIAEETETKLLKVARPCPFCFSTNLVLVDVTPDGSGKYWAVGCLGCHASGPCRTEGKPELAVEFWNGDENA
jgi:hypothetical protein